MSITNVFHNIAGTLKSAFRLGRNGPSLRQGDVDPNIGPVDGLDGDLYIQYGLVNRVSQRRSGLWINISGDAFSRTSVISDAHTIAPFEHYIGVNFAGPVAITLPVGVAGKQFIVKDESGQASTDFPITITPVGVDTIDGNTSVVIQAGYVSLTFVYGSEWHLI